MRWAVGVMRCPGSALQSGCATRRFLSPYMPAAKQGCCSTALRENSHGNLGLESGVLEYRN